MEPPSEQVAEMKDLNLLVFLTQLGFSVVFPLAGFTLLALWLRQQYSLGSWVVYVGIGLGFLCALDGFRMTLKAMERMSSDKRKQDPPLFPLMNTTDTEVIMDSRKLVWQQTAVVAAGEAVGVGIMLGIFALLGRFGGPVLLGGIVGGLLATANFFVMSLCVCIASDKALKQGVKGGQALVQTSYIARMVLLFLILFAFVKSGLCNVVTAVVPLIFVRPTLTIAEFFRKTGENQP